MEGKPDHVVMNGTNPEPGLETLDTYATNMDLHVDNCVYLK